MTEGYSMRGSQAKSVAVKPSGTFSGGKRCSVLGPVTGGASPAAETATQKMARPVLALKAPSLQSTVESMGSSQFAPAIANWQGARSGGKRASGRPPEGFLDQVPHGHGLGPVRNPLEHLRGALSCLGF